MKIRKARKEDIPRILEFFNSDINLIGNNNISFKNYHIEQFVLGPVFRTFVFIENEKIVGAITAEFWKKAKYCYIDNIIVQKEYREKNIGTKLLEYIEELSIRQKMNLVWCFSEEKNSPFHNLAKKLNYQKGKKFIFFSKELK